MNEIVQGDVKRKGKKPYKKGFQSPVVPEDEKVFPDSFSVL